MQKPVALLTLATTWALNWALLRYACGVHSHVVLLAYVWAGIEIRLRQIHEAVKR